MNIKKGGAAAIGAAVIIISISGCAGVRSQVEQGSGAASITSLQTQQDSARREAALQRTAAHGGVQQRATTSLKAQQDAARAESAQQRAARTEKGEQAVQQSFDSRAFDAVSLQQQAIRERLGERRVTVSIPELMRQQKQAESVGEAGTNAADQQGQRLAQYAEQFTARENATPVPTPSPRPISPRNR